MNAISSDKHRYAIGFAAAGAIMTIFFFALVNYLTSSTYLWFIYPSFAVLWWPLSVIFAYKRPKVYSIFGSLMILLFLILDNLLFTPYYLWVLYAAFPVLLWPVVMYLGKRAARLPAAASISMAAIAYYFLLNVFYAPGFPWFIFPTYAVLWWPIAVLYAKRSKMMPFSLAGTLLTTVFFIILNAVTTPHQIWAVFPIFGVLWWPLTIFCFVYRKQFIK